MSLYTRFIDIEALKVGEKSFLKLRKLGLECPYDLFLNYPRKYDDFTVVTNIGDLDRKIGSTNYQGQSKAFTIKGTILGIANKKTRRRGFVVTEAIIADDTGSLKVVWFNQPYLAKMIRDGSSLTLNGSVKFDSFSKTYVMESPTRSNSAKIFPIYCETAGMTSFFISKLYLKVKHYVKEIPEWLPKEILESHNLLSIEEAILNIHEPTSSTKLGQAQRRLAFDELFLISLKSNIAKLEISKKKAPQISADINELRKFIQSLPFHLTNDQRKAIWQIMKDQERAVPMNRLLNGDVGSGKTIVAAIDAFILKSANYKTILMAPTEILAIQHYEVFKGIFTDSDVGIVTASRKENIEAPIIIGTHALLNLKSINNLGLVIVDEQHRFGVKQREALHKIATAKDNDLYPHFLSMTATPIPRTLHLALFGDLDVSIIREKPANRLEINTRFVESWNRDKAYQFIHKQISSGKQAFVVCPLIERDAENGKQDTENFLDEERKTVMAEYEKLKLIFPEFKIGMLHGKMKAKEKEMIMREFSNNQTNILVSTSVIEVGVDIPNATVMMVEDAERFGLAQIHQFRGRVGRGKDQSFCFLFSNTKSEKALQRLKSLEKISDGFQLAEVDLEMRGPGAIFGMEQSGMLELKMASISDRMLFIEASEEAKRLAPMIDKYPKLLEKIQNYLMNKHLE